MDWNGDGVGFLDLTVLDERIERISASLNEATSCFEEKIAFFERISSTRVEFVRSGCDDNLVELTNDEIDDVLDEYPSVAYSGEKLTLDSLLYGYGATNSTNNATLNMEIDLVDEFWEPVGHSTIVSTNKSQSMPDCSTDSELPFVNAYATLDLDGKYSSFAHLANLEDSITDQNSMTMTARL